MARTTMSCAFAALLLSAPLVAAAAPQGTPERPAAAESMRLENGASLPTMTAVASTQSLAPTTPMPLNLPDEATSEEVQSQYAIGIATLVIGTLVLAALVVGALYVVARRTWTVTH